jgi:hypothetical protein
LRGKINERRKKMIDITDRFKKYGDYIGGIMSIMGSPAEDEQEREDEETDCHCFNCEVLLVEEFEKESGLCERCYRAESQRDRDEYTHPDAKC